MVYRIRGVRGATTVTTNSAQEILEATDKLLRALVETNAIIEDDVASVFFTTTPDLSAVFPAKAARDMGWHRTALMGAVEADVQGGIPLCIRILIHWNTERTLDEIQHVYMKGALALRPDLYPDNKIILTGEDEP
jgi:chorismate mutase